MEVCEACGLQLKVIKGGMQSDIGSTDIKTIHLLGCTNESCSMFLGKDLNNPVNIQKRLESTASSVDI